MDLIALLLVILIVMAVIGALGGFVDAVISWPAAVVFAIILLFVVSSR